MTDIKSQAVDEVKQRSLNREMKKKINQWVER